MNSTDHSSAFVRPSRVLGAALGGLGLVALSLAPAYAADADDVTVVNTETIQVYMDAEGEVDSQRVYEQLSLTGRGSVDITNPVEESGLRNLDGFSGSDAEDGVQKVSVDVDGVERLRTVSDYDGNLPLDVQVEYFLDGDPVEPGDIVGASGQLEVRYTVENVTGAEQTVSFPDGTGGLTSETAEVPIPIVGSLTTVAPANFTDVQSKQANLAGDGKGGTKLSFTMTLFPPIGSTKVEFGYTATITDGVVPGTSISALPVNPLQSPSFKTAGESYESGSATGLQLAMGASTIDENLLKLRDGSAELLAGLIKLNEGADELNAGLADEAAPGALQLADGSEELRGGLVRLADGAGQLRDGAGQLASGAGELHAGAGKLSAGAKKVDGGADTLAGGAKKLDKGAGKLSTGAKTLEKGTSDALTGSESLEEGLKLISSGLGQLAGVEGLPKALQGANALKAGVDEIVVKVGTTDQPTTLLGGLQALEAGLTQAQGGSAQLLGGLQQLRGDGGANPGLVAAKGGVDQVQSGIEDAVEPGGSLDNLIAGLTLLKSLDCGPICDGVIDNQILPGVRQSKANLTTANGGLLAVSAGLGNAITGLDTQLIPGMQQLSAGITTAKNGATTLKGGAAQLRDGLLQVQGGIASLQTGLTSAVTGVTQLSSGAGTAYTGSSTLADGLAQIDGGAEKLSAGAGDLAAGTGRLSKGANTLADGTGELARGADDLEAGAGKLGDGAKTLSSGTVELEDGAGTASQGSVQIADGARELADGLGDAADGSGQLADGLGKAAAAAPQLVDGAGRLSDEGMSMLIDAGQDTAQDYGKLFAVLKAGAARADVQNMAYGAPEGAQGLTAYSFELVGDDGESGRNVTRGVVALVLLGAGLAAWGLRRRFA
ncbi:hypothetical protein [Nocardioides sp. SYSU D00065]|uniref:hypothetical protein n=1 Tax=Nocardioides sp. SYSU D00065 TaxID=2817378 RepID=UPI001B32428F|nr:hypothetical protein [Nocardioides sp. SYSU D00065]